MTKEKTYLKLALSCRVDRAIEELILAIVAYAKVANPDKVQAFCDNLGIEVTDLEDDDIIAMLYSSNYDIQKLISVYFEMFD